MSERPPDSRTVRERLIETLELDLVGPWPGHELAEEKLPGWQRPSNWYLTGFLIPADTPVEAAGDDDSDDEIADVTETAGLIEENTEERQAAKKSYFPSSMGLSFLAPAGAGSVEVLVRWGDYTPDEIERPEKPLPVWRRRPEERAVAVELDAAPGKPRTLAVPDSGGLELTVLVRPIGGPALEGAVPAGTHFVSLFLVNKRAHRAANPDLAFAFQPELAVRSAAGFVPRPDLRGVELGDWDDRVADLHYADTPEYASGHGVSVDWDLVDGGCREIRTAWVPKAQVERTETASGEALGRVELRMEVLGDLKDGAAARAALSPLVEAYRAWIARQRDDLPSVKERRRETAEVLLDHAELAAERIARGIEELDHDADALDAFRVANRAVARALRKRLWIEVPSWHSFQLAFLLLNLRGMSDPTDPHRETVDLLFFPTGGGKTEAYLGLAAFAMVLRRLRHPDGSAGGGAGVSVMMRYTLRLLTLDQLGRAAGMVCALELERRAAPERLGAWPFEIGLWVGKAATPNVMGRKGDNRRDSARAKTIALQNDPERKPSPIPLENCPWCGKRFTAASFELKPTADEPRELRVVCANFECEFAGDVALPVLAVDEVIYRRLPAFLVATVDKFASLPFTGESGLLLGGAERADAEGFYGPATPRAGRRLEQPLQPPDVVIQDELHLISGPLGTMAGLYETVIDTLCARRAGERTIRPKIVASTATVRRARSQIQALFARADTQIFPPPGPSRRDSFFARTSTADEAPARSYLGIAAQGRNPKVVLRRTWTALMAAAQNSFVDAGGYDEPGNVADPYMTVLGYFNSLRELGGSRRILEEEVQNTLKAYGKERRRIDEPRRLFRDRGTFKEVVELTSRVSTDRIAEAKRRLEASFYDREQRVDCAIATNMISVGLDIQRLGLMLVFGQPKTHSEYIQATSRVGRDPERPGLVVTLLNIHKPRDRSHYERFRHYHETFYRSVEVSSVTPFSPRALDRGFAGALVALARHLDPALAPAFGAQEIEKVRAALEERLVAAFEARVEAQEFQDIDEQRERLSSVHHRVKDLLDSWIRIVRSAQEGDGSRVRYQQYEPQRNTPGVHLLREMLDQEFPSEHHRKFRANRSLRDVEPQVVVQIRDLVNVGAGDAR